jgi:glycine/D-amino acid oxidase-like deaminating enzyme
MLLEIKNHPLMMQRSASDTDIVPIETGYSFNTIEDMAHHAKTLNCSFVMNCTGLGSSYLCNDSSIQGGRGILLHYDRNNCHRRLDSYPDNDQDVAIFVEDAPWASSNEACYIIPRGNVLLVGGSFKLVHSIETDPRLGSEERNRLLQNARYLGIDTSRTKPVHEWIGYRPWRPTVRVEKEYLYSDGCQEGIPVIHNYGHGGSGWTVFVGAVHEAINLALTSK